MKNTTIILLATLIITGCKNQPDRHEPENVNSPDQPPAEVVARNMIDEEKTTYRSRMRTRIGEMAVEIKEAREKRLAEKDEARRKVYDADIERREETRRHFQEKLNSIGAKTEAEWQEFKREVDTLFNRDQKK